MNKKGFTLIEILVVLVILVAITVAGTFGIQSIQKKSEEQALNELYSEILLAADVYLNENETFATDLLNKEVDEKCIRIYTLQNEGLLSTSLTNPVTKKLIPGNLCVISYLSEDGTIKNSFNEEDNKKKVTLNVINGSSDIAYKNVHHKAVFTVTPNEGITTEDTTMSCDNKANIAMNGNVVTVTNVVKDTTCTVNFKVPTYNVKLNVTNGSVESANLTVEKNKNAEFTITPNEGYSLTLESDSCNGVMEGNVYKVNNITSDKTCNISLKKSSYVLTLNVVNGTSNLTNQNVDYNENATFIVTPNSGYTIKESLVSCSKSNASITDNTLTISGVKSNDTCTVNITKSEWNVYNLKTQTTYSWNKYNTNANESISWGSWITMDGTNGIMGPGKYNRGGDEDTFTTDANGRMKLKRGTTFSDFHSVGQNAGISFAFFYCYTYTGIPSGYKYSFFIFQSCDTDGRMAGIISGSGKSYKSGRIIKNYSQGSTSYGTVTSTSSNAYPSNGISGSYWYVSAGSTSQTLNEPGTLNGTIVADYGTYPENGKSGSYWYVRK